MTIGTVLRGSLTAASIAIRSAAMLAANKGCPVAKTASCLRSSSAISSRNKSAVRMSWGVTVGRVMGEGFALNRCRALLQLKPLEDPLRQEADDQHHEEPDGPYIDHVPASIETIEHGCAHLRWRSGDERRQLHMFRHSGSNETRLDRHYMNAVRRQAISQAGEKGAETCLCGTVKIIGAASAVACHGRDSDNGASPARNKPLREEREDQRRALIIRAHDLLGVIEVGFRARLIAKKADNGDDGIR